MKPLCPLSLVLLLALASPAAALGPEDVYLVTNKNVAESRTLAEHYCARRKVPLDHILVLDLPTGEDISRRDYDEKLAGPLRKQLADKKDRVKVLLTLYGVPLRVGGATPSAEEKAEADKLRKEIDEKQKEQKESKAKVTEAEKKAKEDPKGEEARQLPALRLELSKRDAQLRGLEQRRRWLTHDESHAAVDSELSLLWQKPYELRRWQLNRLYFQVPEEMRKSEPAILMTCRLDGPSVALVKRLIDDAVEVEARGLAGKVYVDARGIRYDPKGDPGFGYGGYDESMREMAKLLRDEGKMAVTLDDRPALFAEGSCTECALYCGWYSLANYVDCCRFVRGAVAWHLASSEAVSLRDPKSKLWCKNLLEKGACATLGPVAEPYTIGFPKPAEFFGFLATGEYTLVECYWKTEMLASWMTVLVGDPLYNPYAKTPKLKVAQVKPSPAGGSFQIFLGGK